MSEPKFKRNQSVIYRGKPATVSSVDEGFKGRTDYEVRYEGGIEGGICEHELSAAVPTPMVTISVDRLIGPALAYAVAMVEGVGDTLSWCFNDDGTFGNIWTDDHGCYRPDEWWELGGSLIDRHKPFISPPAGVDENDQPHGWDAEIYDDAGNDVIGHVIGCPTALVAVCRAVVLARLGTTVSIPADLAQAVQS